MPSLIKKHYIYLVFIYLIINTNLLGFGSNHRENILSYNNNPAALSVYPRQSVYLNHNIWSIQENNFKKHIDSLVSNTRYLIAHAVQSSDEDERKAQERAFLSTANKTGDIIYDIYTKGSSIYKSPLNTSVGIQFRNMGILINKEQVNGTYIKLNPNINDTFLQNIAQNKDNYGFWKENINQFKHDPNSTIYSKKAKLSQYSISYSNRIALPNSKLHLGASLKYMNTSIHTYSSPIDQSLYKQLISYLDSNLEGKSEEESAFDADIGLMYQLNNNKFAIGYTMSNIMGSASSADKNITVDTNHILSIHYKYSRKTMARFNVDLAPTRDLLNNKLNQYMDFGIYQRVDRKSKFHIGLKQNLDKNAINPIYNLGYSFTRDNASFEIDYQFSDYNINNEERKQYDILKLYMHYIL